MPINKKNDTIYRKIRKNLGTKLSLEAICNETKINKDWLGDLERGEVNVENYPLLHNILELSKLYNSKRMCHWFCSDECPIGKHLELDHVDGEGKENIGLIILNIMDAMNKLKQIDLNRLIEISKDGVIDDTELEDYNALKSNLKQISLAYNALLRWEEDGNQIGVHLDA